MLWTEPRSVAQFFKNDPINQMIDTEESDVSGR